MRAVWRGGVVALAILAGGAGLEPGDPGTRPEPSVQGGTDWVWCVRGIRWWADGFLSGNDLSELAGAVVILLACP